MTLCCWSRKLPSCSCVCPFYIRQYLKKKIIEAHTSVNMYNMATGQYNFCTWFTPKDNNESWKVLGVKAIFFVITNFNCPVKHQSFCSTIIFFNLTFDIYLSRKPFHKCGFHIFCTCEGMLSISEPFFYLHRRLHHQSSQSNTCNWRIHQYWCRPRQHGSCPGHLYTHRYLKKEDKCAWSEDCIFCMTNRDFKLPLLV